MRKLSENFKRLLAEGNHNYFVSAIITLSSDVVLNLTNEHIWNGGFIVDDAISEDESFTALGSVIMGSAELIINNIDGDFSEYDFKDATVVMSAGLDPDTQSDYVTFGTYTVDSADYNGATIQLYMLDYLEQLDRPYSLCGVPGSSHYLYYPATLFDIANNACLSCGLILNTTDFPNRDYVVENRPDDESITFREVLSWVATIAGCYVKVNNSGNVQLKWFDTALLADYNGSNLTFKPWNNDVVLDGGFFNPWNTGDVADAGLFTDTNREDADIVLSLYSQNIAVDDVVITGVSVAVKNEAESAANDIEYYTSGTSGYIIEVADNPFITLATAQTIANFLGTRLIGLRFRKLSITHLTNPEIEVGDVAVVVDRKQNTYVTLVTRTSFSADNNQILVCGAATPSKNSATRYSAQTKNYIESRKLLKHEITAREAAIQNLANTIASSSGLYTTAQQTQSGTIYYMHDKQNLEDSKIVWKMTAEAWAVTTNYDGDDTVWNAGITVDGNTIVNILNAVGINADWIRAGSFEVLSGDKRLFYANKDTGVVEISGDNVYIGNQTATEALAELSGALTITLSNEMQGIPVDSDGNYDTFPETITEVRVFYGSQNVTASVNMTYGSLDVTGTLVYDATNLKYVYTATGLSADTGYATFSATYNDGLAVVTASKRFNLYKAYAGKTGPEGSARVYFIEPTASIVKRGIDDVCVPSSVTFYSFYRDGKNAQRFPYQCLFKIDVLREGASDWENVVYPYENKVSETYTITDTDITSIRCTLLSEATFDDVWWGLRDENSTDVLIDDDGSMWEVDHTIQIITGGEQIDLATVPIVTDVSGLTQDKVFNILTDNNKLQGMWYLNGNVYFNASYIGTGILKSSNNATYWNLNTGEVLLSPATKVGSASSSETLGDVQARITANADGLSTEVLNRTNADTGLSSRITQNTNSITTEVNDRKSADTGLSSRITQNTNSITAEVTNRTNADNALSARINVNATAIESRVTSNKVESIIEQNADSIRLKANQIVWNATNSSMTKNGTLTATNGKFSGKVTGSQIEGTSVGDSGENSYLRLKNGIMYMYRVESSWKYEEQDGSDAEIIRRLNRVATLSAVKAQHYYDEVLGTVFANYYSDIASALRNDAADSAYSDINWGLSTYENSILYNADVMHTFRIGSTKAAFFTSRDVVFNRPTTITQNAYVQGNLYVKGVRTSGTKSRTVQTEDYGRRLLYCYETPAPLFGDVGEGVINSDGLCYVQIDPSFLETVQTSQYQVFLQAYGDGKCYVKERKPSYFIVAGEPGLEFGWEMKARQIDFAQLRFERDEPDLEFNDIDYVDDFTDYLKDITVNYATLAEEHINEVNKERGHI